MRLLRGFEGKDTSPVSLGPFLRTEVNLPEKRGSGILCELRGIPLQTL
jgi:hypothetical protein